MRLIEKILNEKRLQGGNLITKEELFREECSALGLKSDSVIRRVIRGINTDGIANKTVVAMERRYGYSFEELTAEVRQ